MARVEANIHNSVFGLFAIRGWFQRFWNELPHCGTLPEEVWQSRHRFLLAILWFNTLLIAAVGPVLGYRREIVFAPAIDELAAIQTIFWSLPVAILAAAATWGSKRRAFQASTVSVGLMTSSAVLTHLAGGYPEIHFHFFVMVAFMALYQDWAPYVLAVLYVAVHHWIFGVFWPEAIYNYPVPSGAPWTWAGLHAFFIMCTAAASVIVWRFNERSTDQLKLILNSVGEGIFGLDREGKVTFVNPAAAVSLGWDPSEIIGRPLPQVLGHRRKDGTLFKDSSSPIFVSLRDGTRQTGGDHLFSRTDGTDVAVDFTCTPVIWGRHTKGAVVSFRDVTARQKAEERLRQAGQLQTLHEISRTILESRDIRLLMEGILDKVLAIGGFDIGMICLAAADRKSLEPVAHRGFRDRERWNRNRDHREQWPRTGIVDQVLTTRQIQIVDLSNGDRIRTFHEEGAQHLVIVPLRTDQEGLGVIYLGTRSAREFQAGEIEILDAIGLQVGIAIQKSKLFEQSEESKRELKSANRRLEKLLEDQSNLYANLTPLAQAESTPQLLEKVIDRLMEATGADAASIRFLDQATQKFYVPAQRGFPAQYLEAPRAKVAGTATAVVFDTGEPIVAADIETDWRVVRKLQTEAGFRSCAFLPLKVRSEVRGIVQLASRKTGFFNAGRESYLMAIVRQMGIALENRELFEEINAAKIELQRSNQDLEQFAYVASHDLQEPLRMVSGYTQLLAKRYKGRLDSEADEFIGFAVSGANRMQALIQGLLEFSRVRPRKSNPAPADCNVALQVALAGLRVPIEESGAEVSYDPLPRVMVYEPHLVQLFQNLIGNGIKYQSNGSPRVHVSCEPEGECWRFSVKDNGIGIDRQYTERIFLIFQRLHTQHEYSGAGIGLALCKKIVERYGGKIWVESELGKGSEFIFTLPALSTN